MDLIYLLKEPFDIDIHMKLTRKQTKEVKELLKDHNHYKFPSEKFYI